ncbi:MAG: hypothetical protein GIW95_03335 [Candidatus Eremiobacteraeota bacterium]|nr:hypothetical protein [Candidatus Eremiobacteraeota bacterium]
MRIFRWKTVAAALAVCSLAAGGAVLAQGVTGQNIAGFEIRTNGRVNWNINNGDYAFLSRFTASKEGTDITGDAGSGNSKRKTLSAVGHVVVHQTRPLKGSSGQTSRFTQEPSTLTCDKLDVDGATKRYAATGDVHFTQTTRDVTAERGTLDDNTHVLHMEGHVHIRNGEQLADADNIDYNTLTEEVQMSGNVLIRQPLETPPPGTPGPRATPKKNRK